MESTAKKVRFANIPPQTPSPASSNVSLGSSSRGPYTPPQMIPAYLPPTIVRPAEYPPWQQRITVPSSSSSPPNFPVLIMAEPQGDPVIDSLLAAPSRSAQPPPLRWDLMENPNTIKLTNAGSPRSRQLSHEDLARCAVRLDAKGSPLLLRRVLLTFPGLPLRVEITPADDPVWTSIPLPYLTVGDVFYGLYKALRSSVEPREFDSLEPAHREAMSRAFKKRLQNDRGNYDRNVHHGVRRIDYLGEMRRLVGLRPAIGVESSPGRRKGEVFVVLLAPA